MRLTSGDVLLIVDVQNDFLPGGALAVPRGDEVIDPLNRYIGRFRARSMPILATRDWHPPDHCSFHEQDGPWPPHCQRDSEGAAFPPALRLPAEALVIDKATEAEHEAYSGFSDTDLDATLCRLSAKRLFVGGLATDYCVLQTVLDGLHLGYSVTVLEDAVRAVELRPGDGARALQRMRKAGATFATLGGIEE